MAGLLAFPDRCCLPVILSYTVAFKQQSLRGLQLRAQLRSYTGFPFDHSKMNHFANKGTKMFRAGSLILSLFSTLFKILS